MRIKLFITCIFLAVNANAVILGYVTGTDYIEMNQESRINWLVGTMDGIMAESISIGENDGGPWLGACIERHNLQQIKSVFEKELNGNPEGWHAPAAIIFRSRINEFCNAQ